MATLPWTLPFILGVDRPPRKAQPAVKLERHFFTRNIAAVNLEHQTPAWLDLAPLDWV